MRGPGAPPGRDRIYPQLGMERHTERPRTLRGCPLLRLLHVLRKGDVMKFIVMCDDPKRERELAAALEKKVGVKVHASRHRHRAKVTQTVAFRGPINGAKYNAGAHGNVMEIAVCSCGATRATNINGCQLERGKWVTS